jgi:hypothetical protein
MVRTVLEERHFEFDCRGDPGFASLEGSSSRSDGLSSVVFKLDLRCGRADRVPAVVFLEMFRRRSPNILITIAPCHRQYPHHPRHVHVAPQEVSDLSITLPDEDGDNDYSFQCNSSLSLLPHLLRAQDLSPAL